MKISITLIVVAATLAAARPVFDDDFDVTNVARVHARRQFARRSEDFDLWNLAQNHVRRQFARRSEDDHLAVGHHVRRQNLPDCNVRFDECVAQCGDNACEDQCDQEKSECLQRERKIPDDDDKIDVDQSNRESLVRRQNIDVDQSNRESLVRRQNTPDCNTEFDECADKCGADICIDTVEGTNCPNEACHNQCDEEKTQCNRNRSQGQNRLKRRANAGNPGMQDVALTLVRRSEEVALRRRSEEVASRRRQSQRQNRLKRRADAEYPKMQEAVLRRRSERSLVRRQNAPDCNEDLVQCVDQCVDSTCEDQCDNENFECRRNSLRSQVNRRQLRRRTEM